MTAIFDVHARYDHVGLKPESSGAPPGGWYDEPNYLKLEDTGTDGVLHPLVTAPGGMLRPAGTTRHGTLHFTPLWVLMLMCAIY